MTDFSYDTIYDTAVVFILQSTSPIASLFISLHHNVSGAEPTREVPKGEPFFYEAGWKDACAVFFYSLVCIVMHAILQEYFLDVSVVMIKHMFESENSTTTVTWEMPLKFLMRCLVISIDIIF